MKTILLFFIFLVSGCSNPPPVIYPQTSELISAEMNKFYQQNIEIKGGAVNKSSLMVNIYPTDSGLMWKPQETKYIFDGKEETKKDYHNIIIFGTPLKKSEYHVIVSGFTLGTTYPGKDFYRKYTIKIK